MEIRLRADFWSGTEAVACNNLRLLVTKLSPLLWLPLRNVLGGIVAVARHLADWQGAVATVKAQ